MEKKFILMFLCFVFLVSSVSGATYYISPTGNDLNNGLTENTSFKTFLKTFSSMSSGDELILLNGTYSSTAGTGTIGWYLNSDNYGHSGGADTNSEQIPSGTSREEMTYVHAKNPGDVKIEGQLYIGRSFRKDSYIKIEGITFTGGALYNSEYVYIKNSGFNGQFTIGTNDHDFGNNYNLIEDVWIWAKDQRIIAINYRSNHNIWRRVVVRGDGCNLDGCLGSGNPNVGITVYDSSNISLQNVIVVDRILNGGSPFSDFASAQHTSSGYFQGPNEWLGTISLNAPDIGYEFGGTDYNNDYTVKAENIVAWDSSSTGVDINGVTWTSDKTRGILLEGVTSGVSGFDSIRLRNVEGTNILRNALSYNAGRYGINVGNVQVSYVDIFGAGESDYYQYSPQCTLGCFSYDPIQDGSLKYITRIEEGSNLKSAGFNGKDIGANVIYKYGIEGSFFGDEGYNSLTENILWPWPNEDRIKKEMCTDSEIIRGFCADGTGLYDGPITLTSYIWEYLGNECPPEICNYNLSTCTDVNGTCQTDSCSNYQDCTSLSGTCSSGNCCSGTCTGLICTDSDGDGYNASQIGCGIADCNDLNLSINPEATEVCGNGVDEDCSGSDLECPVNESDEEEEVPVVDDGGGSSGGSSSGGSSSTPECVFTNAFWSVVSAVEGQQVSLTVEGTDCDGEEIDLFVIWEDDLIGDDSVNENPSTAGFSDGRAVSSWTVEYQDDFFGNPEYYFISTLKSDSSVKIDSRDYCDLLRVDKAGSNRIGGCPNYVWTGIR